MAVRTVNPYTNEVIAEFAEEKIDDAKLKISKLKKAQSEWSRSLDNRIDALSQVRDRLVNSQADISRLITTEMGKSISQSEYEVKRTVELFDFFLKQAPTILSPEIVKTEAQKSYVRFDPLGIILLIEPWNSPLWQVMRPAVPALLAGNAVFLKHASNVSGTSLKIRDMIGLDVFDAVIMRGSQSLEIMPFVDAVSFTGSTEIGSEIARRAGQELKKSVLELGGSDPFIILDDSNMEQVVKYAVSARLRNNGQSCIAAKRFIVNESVSAEFYRKIKEEFFKVRMGDPMDRGTYLGPLVNSNQKNTVENQVSELGKISQKLERVSDYGGNFVSPTVATTDALYDEEIFGPVAIIKSFKTIIEAIQLANETPFGLGASIWGDPIKAEQMVPMLETGNVFVNQTVTSDPRLPFGGVKKSGYGRELSSYGMKEFANIKSVWVK